MLTALLDSWDMIRKVIVACMVDSNDIKTSGRIPNSRIHQRCHFPSLKLHFYAEQSKDRDVSPALVTSLSG